MARISFLLLLLGALVSLVAAGSAPVFCKCSCGKNSTIIPLGPENKPATTPLVRRDHDKRTNLFDPDSFSPPDDLKPLSKRELTPRSKSKSCSECTKAFCLNQGISFCKDVEESLVTTMCFQRDSNKDKIIVWGFIVGTVGLLGWAVFKRLVELREGHQLGRQAQSAYSRMPTSDGFR